MALDEALALTNRLLSGADALESRELYDSLDESEREIVIAFSRSYLRQALDLLEDPARAPGWAYTDPVLLQAQGSASAAVAHLLARAGIGSPDARILDVGTGVAGLAIALCSTFPESTVVGLDPWEPPLAIAQRNVTEAGLESRITLLDTAIQDYDDPNGFDLVWLPSFFIPESLLDEALSRIHALLRPGGTLVVGTTQTDEQSLDVAVDDLRTVRSGGSVVSATDAHVRLERAGFADVREPDLGMNVPLRLVAGIKP